LRELSAAAEITGAHSAPLRAALNDYWSLPWVVCLIGKSGPQKSNLVDSLANRQLGSFTSIGFTERLARFDSFSDFLIDTPGLDTPRATVAQLGPVAGNSDLLIWIVDGSKKISANERLLLTSVRRPGQPVHVVLTNLDGESPRQRGQGIARAKSTLSHIAPLTVRIIDGKTPPSGLAYLTRRVPWESPRRLECIEHGLLTMRDWMAKNQPSPAPLSTLTYLTRRWRSLTRLTCDSVLDRIIADRVTGRTHAINTLARLSNKSCEAYLRWMQDTAPFNQWVAHTGNPILPPARTEEASSMNSFIDYFGGRRLATQCVLKVSDRWRLDGELQIQRWLELAQYDDKPKHRLDFERLEKAVHLTNTTLANAQQMLRSGHE